jgi:Ni/Co efflux regulator RcnB
MIRIRRLLTILAAALLAGAPGLAAQADTPNPFGQPHVEGHQRERLRDDHFGWHRGRHLERRGERLHHRHRHHGYYHRRDGRI